MSLSKNIHAIQNIATGDIVELENRIEDLNTKEEQHFEILNEIHRACERSPFFFNTPLDEQMNIDFSFVTSEWIRQKLEELNIKQTELAAGVNATAPQVNGWLSGVRNPSGPAQAAIYYYIISRL